MAGSPEEQARNDVDQPLGPAGWAVQDFRADDLQAARGVALRKVSRNDGVSEADCLSYVGGEAAGVIKRKKVGATLTGVEAQCGRYS